MPVTVITNAGVAAWTAAGTTGPLLNITGAAFGSTLFDIPDEANPNDPTEEAFIASLQESTLSSLGTVVYTATSNQMRYRVINSNVVMFQIILDTTVGNFTFGNFGLLCTSNSEQFLFTVTALDQSEVKTATSTQGLGNYRTYNVLVTLNNVANLSDFTIQIAEDASIAEVPNDAALPNASEAVYNLYLVDTYSVTTSPALATPVNGNWYFYANLAYVQATFAPLYSPQFTGAPTVNATQGTGGTVLQTPASLADTSGAIPNTKWVQGVAALYAPLNGANFTGPIYAPVINSPSFVGSATAQFVGPLAIYKPYNIGDGSAILNMYADAALVTNSNQTDYGDMGGSIIKFWRVQTSGNLTTAQQRWQFVFGVNNETGSNVGSDILLGATADNGTTYLGNVFTIQRSTQIMTFDQCPLAPTPPAGDSSQKLVTTNFLNGFGGNVPVGGIIMFNSLSGFPENYLLCDGSEGTPDLRDKFVMGAGNVAIGLQGGYASQSSTTTQNGSHNHGGADGAVVLTINQIPSHTHGVTDPGHVHSLGELWNDPSSSTGYDTNSGHGYLQLHSYATESAVTNIIIQPTGGNAAHSHTISTDGLHEHSVNAWDNRPPFYALAFIMRQT